MTLSQRAELVLLSVAGFVLGLLCVFYLNLYIGSVPFPVTAAVAAVGNLVLLRLASGLTDTRWRYAPMAVWTLVAFVAMVPGINGNGALIGDWRVLALILGGIAIPVAGESMRRLNNL